MGEMKYSQLILFLSLLCLKLVGLCKGGGSIYREVERKVLIDFKKGLEDLHECLSSWIGLDYCSLISVHCYITTTMLNML